MFEGFTDAWYFHTYAVRIPVCGVFFFLTASTIEPFDHYENFLRRILPDIPLRFL